MVIRQSFTACKFSSARAALLLLALVLPLSSSTFAAQAAPAQRLDAADLYRRLASVHLDPQQIFTIRDGSLEREDLHLTFDDGTIAFTRAVDGHVTGALFLGDGQVLLVPPNQTERQSLALFTGAAVLSERFSVAYLRFSDDKLVSDLRSALRPPESAERAKAFLEKYDPVVANLAERDALRSMVALTNTPDPSRFLRARVTGVKLGTFDVMYDTGLNEQISAAQVAYGENAIYYDLWTSFPARSVRQQQAASRQHNAEASFQSEGNAGTEEGAESLVISDYEIDARVQPPTDLAATATLDLQARASGGRVVLFELSQALKVSAVTIDGKSVEFLQNPAIQGGQVARRGNDLVAVVFPQAITSGMKARISFTYAGPVISDAGGGLFYVGARGNWYPNRGLSMANYRITFRHPAAFKLVATGKRVSSERQGTDEVSHWISERPIPVAGFNLGKYDSATAQAAGSPDTGVVTVESYASRATERALAPKTETPQAEVFERRPPRVPPPLPPLTLPADPARNVKKVAENSARSIDFLSSRIGPYPYSSLSLTQMPGSASQGWPGLVFLSSMVYLDAAERGRRGDINDIMFDSVMQAHETAHQWWGDAVLWKSYRDQWLMEALANYCALLQLEPQHPDQFRQMMETYRKELLQPQHERGETLQVKDAGPVTLGARLNSSKLPHGYDVVAYGRGTWLIHMLRHMLRDASRTKGRDPDALFFSVLRKVQQKYAGKLMSSQDFLAAIEEVLPKELWYENSRSMDWFMDQWVNGFEVPRYELRGTKFTQSAGKSSVSTTLLQKDAPDSLVTSVPIYAQGATGAPVYVGRVFADGEETQLKLRVPPGARKLLVDPFGTVLTRP